MSDLIEREDAIKATWQEPTYTDPLNVLTEVRDRIEAIPSARPKEGKWIFKLINPLNGKFLCSECGKGCGTRTDFCPNCGCAMTKNEPQTEREGE